MCYESRCLYPNDKNSCIFAVFLFWALCVTRLRKATSASVDENLSQDGKAIRKKASFPVGASMGVQESSHHFAHKNIWGMNQY